MNKILKAAKNLIKNPYLIYPYLGGFDFLNWLPDAVYLKGCFKAKMGYKLDLQNPKTFNEKLQWLKLYDRKPEYTQMVDKYAVREYIKNTIGEEYLIPLLGVWDSFDEIDFDALPNQFVLKCNHDSGSVIICKDKKTRSSIVLLGFGKQGTNLLCLLGRSLMLQTQQEMSKLLFFRLRN